MKATVQQVDLRGYDRILAVSDIHGQAELFDALLQKVGFGPRDALVLVGDLTEKGPDSLGLLRQVMRLWQGGNVFAVTGNCDLGWGRDLLAPENLPFMREYVDARISQWNWSGTILWDMCREAGLQQLLRDDPAACQRQLLARYAAEWAFLQALPTVLVSEDCTFVHAALPGEQLQMLEQEDCVRCDAFCAQEGPRFAKTCIVGHWPTSMYRQDKPCHAPVFNARRNLFGIDGGCVLKDDGQLNCLVRDNRTGCWDYAAVDGFATAVALDAQRESERSFYLRWVDDRRVQLLQKGEAFSLCRHSRTGYELAIENDRLYTGDGGDLYACDCSDYHLPVQPGDTLSVVRRPPHGYWVKKNSVCGWYRGRLQEE